jgi:GAF domain-containing protein
MFKRITGQIKTLDEKRQYLDADWEQTGNHSLLDFQVKIMPQVIDAELCNIFIQDPMQQSVWLKAGTGAAEEEFDLSLDDGSIVSNVIATGEPAIVHGLNETDGVHSNLDVDPGFVAKNIMCIPIKSLDGKEITGAIQLLNKKEDEMFSDADQAALEEMAHYLEWSLENIRYHEEAKEILEGIYSVLTKIVIAAVAMLVLVSPILMLWGFPYIVKFFSGGM